MVKINKKAMEMSLNLIIMLIIGMVILGLVIGFVNNLVGKGTESFDKQLGDNEKLKLDEVKNCPDNLCISPYPSVTVKKGGETNVFIKVRAYMGDIDCPSGKKVSEDSSECQGLTFNVISSEGLATSAGDFYLIGPGLDATDGTDNAQMYILKVQNSVSIGTYFAELELYPGQDNSLKKSFTINVE